MEDKRKRNVKAETAAGALKNWQDKYEKAKESYGDMLNLMGEREELYKGTRRVDKNVNQNVVNVKKANHIRNIVFELIESQIDSTIPMPKVTTMTRESVPLSKMIEDSIKTDLERIPIEALNDEQERTTPIQGGSYFLVEWDNAIKTHDTVGDLSITVLHPKNVIPQAGLYSLLDADHVFVRLERTKAYIKRRYGVDVSDEDETEAGIGTTGDAPVSEDKVTQVICYYKNEDGGVGLFSWVGDTVLEDLSDYQARQMERCTKCGNERPFDAEACSCGNKQFETVSQEWETLVSDMTIVKDGQPYVIPVGTKIPYYKPNRFPLVLRKNVSAFGQLLGDSDVDKIRDQQMLVNKLGSKIEEKLLKGGSYVSLPRGVRVRRDDSEFKTIDVQSPQEVDMIKAINLQPNISYDSVERERAYMEAKSTLGITDTFQGKPDNTAVSGVAKRIQVEQSSGRLESKRRMKAAAYAELFETMFLFKLAYTDEPRPFMTEGANGEKQFGAFSRYAFLCVDDAGEFYYDDKFLFSTDPAGALGQNRQAMWEETRRNLQEGAFGNPQEPQTLLMFWGLMETLGYPMAGSIKANIAQKMEQEQMQAQMMQQMQAQMQQAQAGQPGMAQNIPPGALQAGAEQAGMEQGIPQGMDEADISLDDLLAGL